MFDEKNKGNRTVSLLFFAAMIIAAVMIAWSGRIGSHTGQQDLMGKYALTDISEDWIVERAGRAEEKAAMPFKMDAVAGEAVTLRRVLPAREAGDTVCFYTAYSAVEVRMGGEPVYRYDPEGQAPFGKAMPGMWNLVRIPQEYAAKEVEIRITSPYRNTAGVLSPVRVGDALSLMQYLAHRYIPKLIVCGIFLALGIAVFISSFPLKKMTEDVCTIRCFGIFAAIAACWMMSEVELPIVLWPNAFTRNLICYFSMMLCPIAFLLYLLHRFPERYQKIFRGLCYLFAANFFTVFFLQVSGIADFVESAWISHLCLCVMAAALVLIMIHRIRGEKPVTRYLKLETVGIASLLVGLLAETYLFHQKEYLRGGDSMQVGLIAYMVCMFAALMLEIRERWTESVQGTKELQESRLRLMVSQIKPHFIYNTLSSIRTLIKIDPDRAYDLVYDFSRYLRSNIDSIDQSGMIPFAKELEHIRVYCGIENVRFGDKLSILYEIEEEQFLVPPLTVQPLVENAIKHGIRGKGGAGTVKVRSSREDGGYRIEVLDDGAGFDPRARMADTSLGLRNIRFRLQEIAGADLVITSILGKGTSAVIHLPPECAVPDQTEEGQDEDHSGR